MTRAACGDQITHVKIISEACQMEFYSKMLWVGDSQKVQHRHFGLYYPTIPLLDIYIRKSICGKKEKKKRKLNLEIIKILVL